MKTDVPGEKHFYKIMKACYIVSVFLLGVVCVSALRPERQPISKDFRLRELLEALKRYATKQENVQSRDSLRHQLRSSEDNSLEQNELGEEDENNAERQTILVGNKIYKPKNLHVNKDQKEDDNKDTHPKPPIHKPVVGVKKSIQLRNFGISSSFLWTNGIIPYEIDGNSFGTRSSRATQLVQSTIDNIASTTCVRWRPKTSGDQFFVKIKGDEDGCWSFVGNVQINGGQGLNLGPGCLDEYVVLHELHHAMGGIHEQQRDKRKYFVKINWDNIYPGYTDQYSLNSHTRNSEVYDYASILQYHLTAFTSNGRDTMTIPDQDLEYLISNSKYALSYYDMAEINNAYTCPSASCSVSCQNEGFRMQAVDQTTCKCHCPSGLKGATCEELDTDADCGKIITLSNGGSEDINMMSYAPGKLCTWLVKGESDSIIKATVTSIDLPYSTQNDCYHWLEFRDYLIGDPGKELCGTSTTPKTYTQAQIGKVSPFLMRFNSQRSYTPGNGFTVKVEAIKSGCLSSPCKTGSLCTEGPGDGTYTCACQNGLSGTNCDQFRAPSYNFCNHEDDFGTCLFDQDPSSEIRWNFNTRLCEWEGCETGMLARGSGYQFLTLTPYYDSLYWNFGSKAAIKTSAQFTAVDRCLSFDYAIGTLSNGRGNTAVNVYVEGTGKAKTKISTYDQPTDYAWRTATVSIEAVDNLVITIEGVFGAQMIGVDNISLRPGLCTNTPCNPSPCQNGGNCDDSNPPAGSKYLCSCTTGFSGDRCENTETVDNCANNPCTNGGTCNPTVSGYSCDCTAEYTGNNCESINHCFNSPCSNGGTCTSADLTFSCQCTSEYTGSTCDTLVPSDLCELDPCMNGGTCISTVLGFDCTCSPNFTGINCETPLTGVACNFDPCQNGGTCTQDNSGPSCACPADFSGERCELPIPTDACSMSPCLHNGTCNVLLDSSYSCVCSNGYTGDNCESVEVVVDPCLSDPCENYGSCVQTPNEETPYRCDCREGFLGPNCEGFSCRFESRNERACFLDTRNRAWLRRTGRTPSRGTGPNSAFEGRYYFYFEASFKRRGGYNVFDTGSYPYKNTTYCLGLHYHMYGRAMGVFSLMTYSTETGYRLHKAVAGNQGNVWHYEEINLDLNSNTWIVLQALKQSNAFRSDIAIDDVTLMPYPCPVVE